MLNIRNGRVPLPRALAQRFAGSSLGLRSSAAGRAHYPTDVAAGLATGLAAEKAVDATATVMLNLFQHPSSSPWEDGEVDPETSSG